MLVSFAVPANAAEASGDALETLQAVTSDAASSASAVLSDVAAIPTDSSGTTAIDATVNGVDVVIPVDPASPISLDSSGSSVSIELPFAASASEATAVMDGAVAYENGNGSTTVPVVKNDGSLQIATIIARADAPTRYAYDLSLPSGSMLVQEDGMVVIREADGSFAGGFAPAWATDANGADVATRYEIEGSTLVQVVEHTTSNVAYPVTADPYLGIALIQSGRWVNKSQGRTLEITPTAWGRANGNNPTAVSALNSEFCGKFRSACTTQMWWQLGCHAQFAPFKGTWNLDAWRYRPSYYAYIQNGCN